MGGSDPDGVGVGERGVADPALWRAGLNGWKAKEADLQTCDGDFGQLEAQSEGTDLQHGGRAEAGNLQLKTEHSKLWAEGVIYVVERL